MNALIELRKRARTPANSANSANLGGNQSVDSQDSQDSQVVNSECGKLGTPANALKDERSHLLELAAADWIDAVHVHRLDDADIAGCLGLDDRQRSTFLHMLEDTAERMAGRPPAGDTAVMHCRQCGPVWTHPTVASALPVVDGWPRCIGCAWCHVRKAGGYIPRPKVACENCQHFNRDTINAAAGVGTCSAGHGTHYPMQQHRCGTFRPRVKP